MATRILIDGYNFLWQSATLREAAITDFEKGRAALIAWLTAQPRLAAFNVTIVFDAHKTAAREATREVQGTIEILYTAGGQTADDLIREMAGRLTAGAIVVSSDREVQRHAEKKGCGVLGSREFQTALERPESFEADPARRLPQAKRKALAKLTRLL